MLLTEEDIKQVLGFGEFTTESTKVTLECVARAIEAKIIEKIGDPVAYEGKFYGTFSRSNYGDDENTIPLYQIPWVNK